MLPRPSVFLGCRPRAGPIPTGPPARPRLPSGLGNLPANCVGSPCLGPSAQFTLPGLRATLWIGAYGLLKGQRHLFDRYKNCGMIGGTNSSLVSIFYMDLAIKAMAQGGIGLQGQTAG